MTIWYGNLRRDRDVDIRKHLNVTSHAHSYVVNNSYRQYAVSAEVIMSTDMQLTCILEQ